MNNPHTVELQPSIDRSIGTILQAAFCSLSVSMIRKSKLCHREGKVACSLSNELAGPHSALL